MDNSPRAAKFGYLWTTLVLTLLGAIAMTLPARPTAQRRLFYNPSASAPQGWYWVSPGANFISGSYVLAQLPEGPAMQAAERGYLPPTMPILKRLAALPGQEVCEIAGAVQIDGRSIAQALKRDGQGRELEPWSGCSRLGSDECFLLSTQSRDSFDSRYFGPVPREAIIGRAIPIWTW